MALNPDLFTALYKPDVLMCLADLSNDEVFTPPDVANQVLDLLPQELFRDPNTKFLDPALKSGVFLREIAKRLIAGLADKIPNLQERCDWIFKNQLYGIAITELTSLLGRRSVYCSKYPNSPFSITKFDDIQGNIVYHKIRHRWDHAGVNGKCIFCGTAYDGDLGDLRREGLETYAYEFIHTLHPEDFFNMKFDVIISNPPYMMRDGGGDGSSAQPIYQKFVEQALKLNPRYMSMIIPARWYSGGKGLDEFRAKMLHDQRISIIHDFPETADCFPGVNIRGGVCYFLWDRAHSGDTDVINHYRDDITIANRPLLEKGAETFIRYNKAISILNKVMSHHEEMMNNRISARLPFGIPSNFTDYSLSSDSEHTVKLYRSERNKNAPKQVYINPKYIVKNYEWKDSYKVLVSKASPGGDEYPHAIISAPVIAEQNSVCTETYLIVDFVDNIVEANNLVSYMKTKFFRFMMSLIKNTQNIAKGVFAFVPVQSWEKSWTDHELYEKYGITHDEISFIDSMIKPMD